MSKVLNSLVGETLTYVDAGDESILLTTASGRKIQIYHSQDCCESVRVVDTVGNWHDLVGKVVIEVDEEIYNGNDGEWNDSQTNTNLTFKVEGATVISKWIGESNGYYSESVDFKEIADVLAEDNEAW